MKKILGILLSGIMIFVLVGCGSTSGGDKQENTTQEEESQQAIKFGEVGKTDKWEIKVLEVSEPDKIEPINEHYEPITTTEKFVVVKLEMKNISNSPEQYSGKDFIISNNGTTYKVDDVGFGVMQTLNSKEIVYNDNVNFVGVYEDINPGMTKSTYIAFNIPKDVDINSTTLGIKDENKVVYMNLK